jgi:hypothetical protein
MQAFNRLDALLSAEHHTSGIYTSDYGGGYFLDVACGSLT